MVMCQTSLSKQYRLARNIAFLLERLFYGEKAAARALIDPHLQIYVSASIFYAGPTLGQS